MFLLALVRLLARVMLARGVTGAGWLDLMTLVSGSSVWHRLLTFLLRLVETCSGLFRFSV